MKIATSLLLLSLLALCGCNTPNTRRDLYWPKSANGYWTMRKEHGKAVADASLMRTKEPPINAPAPAAVAH